MSTRSWLWRLGVAAGVLFATIAVAGAVLLWNARADFGARAKGERRARVHASPQWAEDRFVNPQPLVNDGWLMLKGAVNISDVASPLHPVPTAIPDIERNGKPASGLRVTWMGHSTTLLEIDGVRVLTDPIWSNRASPLGWVGPQRWYDPPLALADLPPIDAVVISHDHYDHLDRATVAALATAHGGRATFIVGLGVGAHLEHWGVPAARIVELDWWGRKMIGGMTIVSTPARHASGRILLDNDSKLWTGFALLGPQHRVYYSGDTGLFPAMREIGERLGPFDLTMIEAGQYDGAWPDWHIGPEQAVTAHGWVRGKVMLPVHWGLFQLAYHSWTEPVERVLVAAAAAKATIVVPRPGQTVDLAAVPAVERWWPTLPWRTAAQAPVVSGQVDVGPARSPHRAD